VAQGRRLVLDGVRPPLARLLAVTRLNRVLVIRRSHEAADRPGRPAAEDPAA
jgi:anti-anti-sigma regulatory factor